MTITAARTEIAVRRWPGAARLLTLTGASLVATAGAAVLTRADWSLGLSLVAAALLAVTGGLTLFESLRAGRGFTGVGACVLAVVLYLAVHVSGSQLLSGERISILTSLGYQSSSLREDTFRAAALFVLAAGALSFGEGLVAASAVGLQRPPRRYVASYRPVFVTLIVLGIVVTLWTAEGVNAETLNRRGQVSGQGALGVVQQTLPIAVAIGVLFQHWGSRFLVVLSALGLLTYLSVVQSRSMLLFVGLAAALRAVDSFRNRRMKTRDALGLLALTYAASAFIVAFGQWRSTVRTYGSSEFLPWLLDALPAPWLQLSAKGSLDTLDGLVLSQNVDRFVVGASVLDPLKGIVNLVPSQIWSDKPDYLGPLVTHYYTNFGGRSGIFLSGPGYLFIVYSGVLGMTLAALVLGLALAYLFRRARESLVLTTVAAYGLCRFLIGGDAFDLQYCLTILLSIGLGVGIVRAVGWLRGGRAPRNGNPACA